jgi:hypothetical protein
MDSSSVNGLSECQLVCICRIASHEVRFRKLAREPFLNHSERIVGHSDKGGCKPDRSPEVGFPSARSLWRKACRNHLVWHAQWGLAPIFKSCGEQPGTQEVHTCSIVASAASGLSQPTASSGRGSVKHVGY